VSKNNLRKKFEIFWDLYFFVILAGGWIILSIIFIEVYDAYENKFGEIENFSLENRWPYGCNLATTVNSQSLIIYAKQNNEYHSPQRNVKIQNMLNKRMRAPESKLLKEIIFYDLKCIGYDSLTDKHQFHLKARELKFTRDEKFKRQTRIIIPWNII
jgi:hypothetical protein